MNLTKGDKIYRYVHGAGIFNYAVLSKNDEEILVECNSCTHSGQKCQFVISTDTLEYIRMNNNEEEFFWHVSDSKYKFSLNELELVKSVHDNRLKNDKIVQSKHDDKIKDLESQINNLIMSNLDSSYAPEKNMIYMGSKSFKMVGVGIDPVDGSVAYCVQDKNGIKIKLFIDTYGTIKFRSIISDYEDIHYDYDNDYAPSGLEYIRCQKTAIQQETDIKVKKIQSLIDTTNQYHNNTIKTIEKRLVVYNKKMGITE